MKNIIKNIVTALILSGLFFVPVFSSAQTSSGIYNESNNLLSSPLNNDISQSELEAIEEIQILEAKTKHQRLFLKRHKKNKNRLFVSISNGVYDDRSQAEVESAEELLNIQITSAFRKLYPIDPIQANSHQFSLISDLLALNYDEEIGVLHNIR